MSLVREAREQEPGLSVNAAFRLIGPRVGVNPDTLRTWCKRVAIDAGEMQGTTTADGKRIRELEHEVMELKRAEQDSAVGVEFLRAGARLATAVVVALVAEHKHVYGVEPICRGHTEHGVPIAPFTRTGPARPRPARSPTNGWARSSGSSTTGSRAGVRKMWRLLQRDPQITARFGPVAPWTVERLMRARALRGVRRGKPMVTTRPGRSAAVGRRTWSSGTSTRSGPTSRSPLRR